MALSPMKTIQGLEYKLSKVQDNAKAAIDAIVSLVNSISVQGVPPSPSVVSTYYLSTNYTPGTDNPINFDTKIFDPNGYVTTGSGWNFKAPVMGSYLVVGFQVYATTVSSVSLYRNGARVQFVVQNTNAGVPTATLISLDAGDTLYMGSNTVGADFQGGPLTGNICTIGISLQ